jgi:transcription-repair coupling factor (superfamily II helicase)
VISPPGITVVGVLVTDPLRATTRRARAAGIADISVQGNHVRFGPVELRESQELRLMRLHPGSIIKPALGTILVPKPMTARVGGRPVRDREVLAWAGEVISSVVMDNVAQAAAVAASRA